MKKANKTAISFDPINIIKAKPGAEFKIDLYQHLR
jgi:hypothetical protein